MSVCVYECACDLWAQKLVFMGGVCAYVHASVYLCVLINTHGGDKGSLICQLSFAGWPMRSAPLLTLCPHHPNAVVTVMHHRTWLFLTWVLRIRNRSLSIQQSTSQPSWHFLKGILAYPLPTALSLIPQIGSLSTLIFPIYPPTPYYFTFSCFCLIIVGLCFCVFQETHNCFVTSSLRVTSHVVLQLVDLITLRPLSIHAVNFPYFSAFKVFYS